MQQEGIGPRPRPPFRWHYNRYSKGARRRNHDFRLSFDQFAALVAEPCAYCGRPPGAMSTTMGLDRVENERGYEPGNVVPCCTDCNRMKSTESADDFLEHVRRIARHWGLR